MLFLSVSEVIVNKRAIQGASTKLRRIPVQPNWDTFVSKGDVEYLE